MDPFAFPASGPYQDYPGNAQQHPHLTTQGSCPPVPTPHQGSSLNPSHESTNHSGPDLPGSESNKPEGEDYWQTAEFSPQFNPSAYEQQQPGAFPSGPQFGDPSQYAAGLGTSHNPPPSLSYSDSHPYGRPGDAGSGHDNSYPLPPPPIPSNLPPEVQQELREMDGGSEPKDTPLAHLRYRKRRREDTQSPQPSTSIPMGVGEDYEAPENDDDRDLYKNPPHIDLVMGSKWKQRMEVYQQNIVKIRAKYDAKMATCGTKEAALELRLQKEADLLTITKAVVEELQYAIPCSLVLSGDASLEQHLMLDLLDRYNRSEHMTHIISIHSCHPKLDWKVLFRVPSQESTSESDFKWSELATDQPVVYSFYKIILEPAMHLACDFYVSIRNRPSWMMAHFYTQILPDVRVVYPIPGPTIHAFYNYGRTGTYLCSVNKKEVLEKKDKKVLGGEFLFPDATTDLALAMLNDIALLGDASIYAMQHLRHGVVLITATMIINDVASVSRWALATYLEGKNPFIKTANDFTPVIAVAGALASMAFLDLKKELKDAGKEGVPLSQAANAVYPLKQGALHAYLAWLRRVNASERELKDILFLGHYCCGRGRQAYLFSARDCRLDDFAIVPWAPMAHLLPAQVTLQDAESRSGFLGYFYSEGNEQAERRKNLPPFLNVENKKIHEVITASASQMAIEAASDPTTDGTVALITQSTRPTVASSSYALSSSPPAGSTSQYASRYGHIAPGNPVAQSRSSYGHPMAHVGVTASPYGPHPSSHIVSASPYGPQTSGRVVNASPYGLTASGYPVPASPYGLPPSGYGLSTSAYGYGALSTTHTNTSSSMPPRDPSFSNTGPSRAPAFDTSGGGPSRAPVFDNPGGGPSRAPVFDNPGGGPSRAPVFDNPGGGPSRAPVFDNPGGGPSRAPVFDNPGGGPSRAPAFDNPGGGPSRAPAFDNPGGGPSRAPTFDGAGAGPSTHHAHIVTQQSTLHPQDRLNQHGFPLSSTWTPLPRSSPQSSSLAGAIISEPRPKKRQDTRSVRYQPGVPK